MVRHGRPSGAGYQGPLQKDARVQSLPTKSPSSLRRRGVGV
jgi:hypothetical protein